MSHEKLTRIMIVDDEETTRRFFCICVNWESLGMQVVCEASNGMEALNLIEDYNPEIVFTDIRMPNMDGLELSRKIAADYPYIKIVILTAFKDFDYAKESINIGISDLLLKPLNKSEVQKVANKLKEEIRAEQQHWSEFDQLKQQLQENFVYLKEKTLNDIIRNSYDMTDIKQRLSYYYPDGLPDFLQISLFEASRSELPGSIFEEQRLFLQMQSLEIAKSFFCNDSVEIFLDNSQRIVVLSLNSRVNTVNRYEQLKALIFNKLKCFVSIGIGNSYTDLKYMSRSYSEALDALKFSRFSCHNQIISFRDDMSFSTQQQYVQSDKSDEIIFFVKAGLEEKAVSTIESMFKELDADGSISVEQLKVICVNVISKILNTITEMGLTYKDVLGYKEFPFQEIFEITSADNLQNYIIKLIITITASINLIRSRKGKAVIENIKVYLHEHISDSGLSLSSVANNFYINLSYLSRIFKKETGQKFSEYLLKIRMEKALELINTTDLKAYQVADTVGISDAYYFSNCFKKFFGESISEYKKRL